MRAAGRCETRRYRCRRRRHRAPEGDKRQSRDDVAWHADGHAKLHWEGLWGQLHMHCVARSRPTLRRLFCRPPKERDGGRRHEDVDGIVRWFARLVRWLVFAARLFTPAVQRIIILARSFAVCDQPGDLEAVRPARFLPSQFCPPSGEGRGRLPRLVGSLGRGFSGVSHGTTSRHSHCRSQVD